MVCKKKQLKKNREEKKMKVLHLTLNGKWFDMILLQLTDPEKAKKEEYREIKGYWAKRFLCTIGLSPQFFGVNYSRYELSGEKKMIIPNGYYRQFDYIQFSNGYSPKSRKMIVRF